MKRAWLLATRNGKEILREPIDLFFGLAFPVLLLLFLSLMQQHIPVSLFALESLAPGVAVFSLSFLSLFGGLLLARDRGSAFLMRLYTSPLRPVEYILGYLFPCSPSVCSRGRSALPWRCAWGCRLPRACSFPGSRSCPPHCCMPRWGWHWAV